jgi:nucleoside-diphosphate kinase
MLEKTLVLIKPDHIDYGCEIFQYLDGHGTRLATARIDSVPKEIIESHYEPHRGSFFFGFMTQSFIGRPVMVAVYQGADVIQRFIELIGPTDPAEAPKDTIRGRYSSDSLELSRSEGRPVQNVIHRSDSQEEFEREFDVWGQYFLSEQL